jgi:hypothetical protein
MRKLFAVAASLAATVVLALPASAQPLQFTCFPGAGPCTETVHFQDEGPFPVFIPCPPDKGAALFSATGNGIAHITVNNAQDAWFTSTFEGQATLVPILITPNPTPPPKFIISPDTSREVFTGHVMAWFGDEFNSMNEVHNFVVNFDGASPTGQTLAFHLEAHASISASGQMNIDFPPDVVCR